MMVEVHILSLFSYIFLTILTRKRSRGLLVIMVGPNDEPFMMFSLLLNA